MMPHSKVTRKRVLLVDDEPAVRAALKLLLSIDEHTVTEASNGREACLMFAPGDFDLVITDLAMPEMKGDELARTIKCLVPSQPILMITGFPGELWSRDNPVDAVLIKPFTIAELRQTIADLVPSDTEPAAPNRPGSAWRRLSAGRA